MRVRKSDLGGHFCQLSNGKTLYLATCIDCGSLLLKNKPMWLRRSEASLNELYGSGVRDWSGSMYSEGELICMQCGKREEEKYDDHTNWSVIDSLKENILDFGVVLPGHVTPVEKQELWEILLATTAGYLDKLWIDKGLHKTEKLQPVG